MKIVRAGTLIDGTGAPAVRDAVIQIDNGRIEAVTTAAPSAAWPAGAEVIDASGLTVLPGLIDWLTDAAGQETAGATVIPQLTVVFTPLESVTSAVKVYVPAVVGVPVIAPVEGFSDRPEGSEPLTIEKV